MKWKKIILLKEKNMLSSFFSISAISFQCALVCRVLAVETFCEGQVPSSISYAQLLVVSRAGSVLWSTVNWKWNWEKLAENSSSQFVRVGVGIVFEMELGLVSVRRVRADKHA